jgi:3-dehydroquinate synthetase
MQTDKKYVGGRNKLIVPSAIGTVEILNDVAEVAIRASIIGRTE